MKLPHNEAVVSLTFTCTADRELKVAINPVEVDGEIATLDEDHIATRWARLGMRYFTQMKEKGMFLDSVPHVKDVNMAIVFSNSDLLLEQACVTFEEGQAPHIIVDQEFEDDYYDDFEHKSQLLDEDLSMSIGMNLHAETIDRIGGLATPTASAAMAIYKLLLDARSQVKA